MMGVKSGDGLDTDLLDKQEKVISAKAIFAGKIRSDDHDVPVLVDHPVRLLFDSHHPAGRQSAVVFVEHVFRFGVLSKKRRWRMKLDFSLHLTLPLFPLALYSDARSSQRRYRKYLFTFATCDS
jgi:hypothetical protein